MLTVVRAIFLYVFILLSFRLTGRRSLRQFTPFDFVLLLLIGETVQQGLLGDDVSMINVIIAVFALLLTDVGFSFLKHKSAAASSWLSGAPLILVDNGRLIQENMDQERVEVSEILSTARETNGLERMDQIKYAILEDDGDISIIPKDEQKAAGQTFRQDGLLGQ